MVWCGVVWCGVDVVPVRGISSAAVTKRTVVMNSSYTADEVYDKTNACPWTPGGQQQTVFYSLNMVTPHPTTPQHTTPHAQPHTTCQPAATLRD